MRIGDCTGAREDFDRALELDDKHAQAYINKGLLNSEAGFLETSTVKDFNRALIINPKYIEDYDRLVKLNPENANFISIAVLLNLF